MLLRDDAPMPLALDALKTPARDLEKLLAFLQQQDFKRLLVRVGAGGAATQNDTTGAPAAGTAVRSMASSPAPQQIATGTSDTAPAQPLPAVEARYQLIT